MYKESKWATEIISLQNEIGSWGYFHTLSEPDKRPITTEQALRRLSILGYTIEDKPIQKAVDYMDDCLTGKKQIPDRREKLHNWDIFSSLMLSTWIRKFTSENSLANKTADTWAKVITSAFLNDEYNHSEYVAAYYDAFGMKPRGGRLVDFLSFYQVSLTADKYDEKTENMVFDYILNKENGIYYIYGDAPLSILPEAFASKQASRYLGAVEILTSYKRNIGKLKFVYDWIISQQNENGKWDMGGSVIDKVYFPLSDSWRRKELRELDCTYRMQKLLNLLIPTV